MFMQFKAGRTSGFTLGNPIVWNAALESIMQVKFYPPRTTALGCCFDSKNSHPEAKRAGLNGNLRNLAGEGCVGLRNEATPLEGAKRRYPAHFLSKLTDADGELQETMHWLGRAATYGYLDRHINEELENVCASIGRKLGKMMQKPEAFG
jgi:hypothetical protein